MTKAQPRDTLPPVGSLVRFKLHDGLAEIVEVESSRGETLSEARERLGDAARAQSEFLDAVSGGFDRAEALDASAGQERDRYQSTLDALASADRGELSSQADMEMQHVTTRPMRVQEVLQNAQPLAWEMQTGGAWRSHPEPNVEIHVERDGYRSWCWRVHSDHRRAIGDAESAAAAVLAAEAVYWLSIRSFPV